MNRQQTFLLLFFLILTFIGRGQYSIDNPERLIFPSILSSNFFACNVTADAGNDTLVCVDDFPVQLNGSFAGNAINYFWSPGSNVSDSSILNPLANFPGTYTLTVESIDDQNLVVNGDFENGDTGFTTDYSTGVADVGNYLISDTPTDYFNLFSDCDDHTTGMGNMMIVDGADIPNQNIWCQTINISANTDYYFSLWATMVGGTNPPELFFTANGNSIGDTSTIPLTNCLWTEISTIWNSGAETSVEFCIINDNTSPFGNDFAIDDILVSSICQVTDEMEISILEANAIASNETIACVGDCIILDGSNSTSGPAIAHEWIAVTGGSIQNGSTLTPTVCDTGIYKLIVTSLDVASGLICYDSISIVVDLATLNPTTPTFTGLDTICSGDTTNYQISSLDPNTNSYDWFVTNGVILNGQNSPMVEVEWSGISSGEICVSAINSCATSDTICRSIFINSPPQEPIISGPTNVCNTTITNYSIPPSNDITNYQWTTPTGTMIQSGDGTEMITLDWGSVQGGDICLVVENNCGADSSCISVVFGSIQINIDSLNPLCSTDNNGWINVTPLAGTAPFSFLWENGEMTDSIGGLTAGTYQVTVSDTDGCLTVETIILQDPAALNLTFSNTEITCNGACDGIIAVEVTGGTAPYDFLWGNNLGTNDSLINVCDGIYNITITDANGCTIEGQTQLNDPPSISALISNDTIICQGESINIEFQFSGIGPFDVELSDGSMHPNLVDGEVISITPNATSTISIISLIDQGQLNCSANSSASISVTINNPPAIPILSGSDSTCQNTMLTYCITNITMVDSFHWTIPSDANFTGQNSDCIEIDWGNSNGGQVCVEAINECGSTQECMDVSLFPIPTSTFSVDPIICIDSSSTITYAGTASSNATFTWDFDGGNIISGNDSGPFEIDWVIAGNYNITLTVEENGCVSTQTLESVVVENPIPNPVINCSSTTSTVTFTWNDVNGATSYQVDDLSGNGGMIIGNTYMVSGLSNGEEVIIEVTAFGNNACGPTTVQASCTADDCPSIDVIIDHIDPICLTPNSPTFNFTATTSGGNNSGNMTWTGNGIIDGATGLFDPNVAGVGVHDITLGYEESNCFYIDVVTIQIFETPTAEFNVDDLICVSDNATITYLGTGTSNASYVWFFNGGNIISGNSSGPYVVNWSTAGDYNITLTVEENGCQSAIFSQNIQVDPALATPNITCESTPESITFSWDDIAGATDYTINELSGINGVQNGNSIVYNNLFPGQEIMLEITAVGNTICGNTTSMATCSANDCPNIDLDIVPIEDICLTNLSPSIPLQVMANGSDGSGIGTWSGNGIVNDVFDPNVAGEGQHELIYSFTEIQCDFSASIFVNVNLQPNAEAGEDDHLDCEITLINLDGSNSTVFGNTTWTTNNGNIVNGFNTLTPEVNAPGVYYLTIENSSCSSMDSLIVTQNISFPMADAGASQELTCNQTCIILGGNNTSQGINFTYSWTSSNGFVSTAISPETCQPGEYFLTVLDTSNNCISASSSVMILENNTPPISQIEAFGNLDCNNTSLVLDGSNSSIGNEIEYQWLDDNGAILGETNTSFEATEQGSYYLQVLNIQTGCFSIDTVFLNDNTAYPSAEIITPEILTCLNTEILLDGSNSSNSSSIVYHWFTTTSGGIQSGGDTNQAMINQPGFYEIIVLDTLNGCETTAPITVFQNIVSPNADAGFDIELGCNETEAMLGSENTSSGINFEYLWTSPNPNVTINSPTDLNPMVDGLGIYNLLVTNIENGCTATDEMQVSQSQNVPQNINLEILESPCHGDDQGMIMIPSIDGGLPPYLYSLNGDPFSTSNIFSNLPIGNYDILIQDANGCELSTMITMSQPDLLSIDLGDNIYIELGDSVMLDPQMTGVFDTIIWESSTNYSNCDTLGNCYFPIVTPTQTALMAATLINEDGCTATDQITIFVEKNRYVYIPNAFAPDGNSDNQVFMIYAGKGVEKINNFKIFSRWGEQLYEAKDFYPNDNSYGWDGNFKGEKMNPGVYVYFAEIEFSDGLKIIYKGDVTLTR
ncbi:MAG: gliding motility-associated C-terminal domain-containing protein [Saprospiraceae bacterium]